MRPSIRRHALLMCLFSSLAWVDVWAEGGAAAGKVLYQQHCALCHGAQGQGVPPMFPNLTGKPVETYAAMMQNYRAGHGHKVMIEMAQSLSEQQMADLLAHIATFESKPAGR
ncbi:MAG: c-type cytochrome [Pseudomonadota bacterium]